MSERQSEKLSLVSVVAIGMGGMIGAGIFALLGVAVSIAGGGVWMAFLLGGVAAVASAYSFSHLALAYPSRGGAATYVNRAYASSMLAGSLNVLLWLGYVVVLALYAHAFGAYTARLMGLPIDGFAAHAVMTGSVAAFTVLNLVGGRVVGRAEAVLVYAKVLVLVAFAVAGVFAVRADRVSLGALDGGGTVLAAAVLFLAYEGFGLMANTAEEIRDPQRNLPRAFMVAVTGVVVVYVGVSFVAAGVADQAALVNAKDYALAVAAGAVGGSWAFNAIAVTAVVSTAGSLNATLYGAARVSYVLGVHGELPRQLGRELWNKPVAGLLVTAGLVVLVTNTVDLTGISLMGSASFLIIYAAVNVAAVRLRHETHVRSWISWLAACLCVASLAGVVVYAVSRDPLKLLFLVGMIGLAVGVETVLQKFGLGTPTGTNREVGAVAAGKDDDGP